MASIGHVVIGMAAGRVWPHAKTPASKPRFRTLMVAMAALAILSLLPDGDVIAFKFGIPYEDQFGHRGATHSIAFALFCGAIAFAVTHGTRFRPHRNKMAAIVFGVVLSHALLDAMTDGGLGVALFWPLTDERYFAPWRPIPAAPIGRRFFTTTRGLTVAATEFGWSVPLIVFALWPRRPKPEPASSKPPE